MINEKSKVHIVYCHPYENSMTSNIKEAYIQGLKDNGVEYTITDLYVSDFNPDISKEEYLRENNNISCPLSEDIILEQEHINNANILTFIFPLFWMDAPAKLVGYFSRVFTKGFKYDDNDETSMKVLDETNFLISAGSSFADLKKDNKIKALETLFIKDRMSDKTKKSRMYFFDKTTYKKEKILKNKQKYLKLAYYLGKNTI